MPCILKARTESSPGVISFTNNEALSEALNNSEVQKFLNEESKSGRWIFGVHMQGQFSWIKKWPQKEWESFYLWPDAKELQEIGIPESKIIPMNCIQFMPSPTSSIPQKPVYDLCIITRAGSIKLPRESLLILRELFNLKPDLKVVWIMPDHRKFKDGNSTYRKQNLERSVFEMPRKLFNSRELKNITFLCTSTEAFGQFPIGTELIYDLIAKSKFSFSFSLSEGTPRAWIESLQVGTPIMINEEVKCGLFDDLDADNTVHLKNEINTAALQIHQALLNRNSFKVDADLINRKYCESNFIEPLKSRLQGLILANGNQLGGRWFLNDLNFRLPCHGEKYNGQIIHNSKFVFSWFKRIDEVEDPTDELTTFGYIGFNDKPVWGARLLAKKVISILREIRGWVRKKLND